MLGTVVGILVLIVWWVLALLVGLWRIKPNDKRYSKQRGPSVGTVASVGVAGTLFALFTHDGGPGE